MSTPYKCPRCGLANSMGSTNCQSCGTSLAIRTIPGSPSRTSPPSPPTATQPQVTSPTTVQQTGFGIQGFLQDLFRKKMLEGQVIHVEPLYMGRPEFLWGRFLGKIGLVILLSAIFGPIVIGIFLALILLSLLLSILLPTRAVQGPGCLSALATQVLSFFLISKLLGPKADVPVRDIRLRDIAGQEHLVRIWGEIISGSLNVGDMVIVEGIDRKGTISFRKGWNKRINSEIRVRRP